MVDRHISSDTQMIKDLREQLVSKNCLLRSVKSQVDNPDRVRERIRKKQEQIDLLTVQIHELVNMISSGDDGRSAGRDWVNQLIVDIESLEDKLNALVHKGAIAKMEKLITKLEASGVSLEDLRKNME